MKLVCQNFALRSRTISFLKGVGPSYHMVTMAVDSHAWLLLSHSHDFSHRRTVALAKNVFVVVLPRSKVLIFHTLV